MSIHFSEYYPLEARGFGVPVARRGRNFADNVTERKATWGIRDIVTTGSEGIGEGPVAGAGRRPQHGDFY